MIKGYQRQAFAEGKSEAGNEATIIQMGRQKIAGCLGCEDGQCVQKDDEEAVYKALEDAEMLLYLVRTASGGFHRTYAIKIPKNVCQTALLISSGSPEHIKEIKTIGGGREQPVSGL